MKKVENPRRKYILLFFRFKNHSLNDQRPLEYEYNIKISVLINAEVVVVVEAVVVVKLVFEVELGVERSSYYLGQLSLVD